MIDDGLCCVVPGIESYATHEGEEMVFWCESIESHQTVLQLDAVKREFDVSSGAMKESCVKVEISSTPLASGGMRFMPSSF